MIRFVALAIFVGMTWLAPAFAEGMDTEQFKPVEPPSNLPRAQRGDKAQNLDRLFEALKAAPDDRETYYRAVLAALERSLEESGAVTRAELDEREQQWERAYLRTPHGQPVELAAGMEPERS